jgi:hypothetical protein
MDLKQLFYNPDDLDDVELKAMRRKIHFQMYAPVVSAAFLGFSMHLVNTSVFRRTSPCFMRIALATGLGYGIGAFSVSSMTQSLFRRFDGDIMHAFDKRYMNKSLNACGLNTSYVSIHDNEGHSQRAGKPY